MTVAPAEIGGAPQYRRLPGRSRGLMGSASLWLARDHVLLVHSRGYVESYRRFYFRDIQAVLLRRTAAAWLWALVLALPLALTLLGAVVSDGVGRMSWLIASGPFALALLIHVLRGASCVCHVRTAVEQTELPALRRLRVARRTCERLRALVEDAQGSVAAETLARGAPGTSGSGPRVPPRFEAAPSAAQTARPPESTTPAVAATLRWHGALFALLVADAALSIAQVVAAGQVLDAGSLALGIAEFLVAIAALVEGRRRPLDAGLRRATLASLVYICAAFVASWVTSIVVGIQAAIQGRAPVPLSAQWLAIASIPVTVVLAVWGFGALRRARRSG